MTLGSGKEWTRRAEDLDARTAHREHGLALGAVGAGPWPELVVDVERAARREADAQAPPSRPSSGGRREVAVGLALPEISGEPLPVAGGDKRDVQQAVAGVRLGCERHVGTDLANVHHLDREKLARKTLAVQIEGPLVRRRFADGGLEQLEPQLLLLRGGELVVLIGGPDEDVTEDSAAHAFHKPLDLVARSELTDVVGISAPSLQERARFSVDTSGRTPSVRATLFADPSGRTATGTGRPASARKTLSIVPSPPAATTRSAGRSSAFVQPSSFTD
jgi:hypothetical protein